MKHKIETIIYLLEKDFFDVNDDKEQEENIEQGEPSEIQVSEALQLRTLWSYLLYSYRLTRQLSYINDAFEPIYSTFKSLFRIFKDFVINYEEFTPDKRKEFLTEFRRVFIQTLKKLSTTLDSI